MNAAGGMQTSPAGVQYYVSTTLVMWAQAVADCQARGMQLVKISSQAINDDLNELALQINLEHFWAGATDVEEEGLWKWLDGSVVEYTNWGGAEPNNIYGEHCMLVQPGWGWNDNGCESTRMFVCGGGAGTMGDNSLGATRLHMIGAVL
jgi:hypothetical protein